MRELATMTIAIDKIRENARVLVQRLNGIAVVGVTKAFCGGVELARALLSGGASALADSRLCNLSRLREAGLGVPLWLLRSPVPAQAGTVVELADISLNTELDTLAALASAARSRGRAHGVLLMIEMGDIREGIPPEELMDHVRAIKFMPGIRLHGLGANFACFGGALPTPEKLARLVEMRDQAADYLGYPLVVSGANSSGLVVALSGGMPKGIDNLRIGESILGGRDVLRRDPIRGLHQDAIVVSAPVIECKWKSFVPLGPLAEQSPFGRPLSSRSGDGLRVVIAMGQQDVAPFGLTPVDTGFRVLGGSSDHIVLDATDVVTRPRVGDAVSFIPTYEATVRAFTSPYVAKVFL